MALVIRPHHRGAFRTLLDEMYRLRHKVFVDRLGWDLYSDGLREMDQFDQGGSFHVVGLDREGHVRAASRLTPSHLPNLTCDILGPQMNAPFPRAPHIIEVSRLCADPDFETEQRREIMQDLRIAQVELSRKEGWTHNIGVSKDSHIQPWIRIGAKVEMIGTPFQFPGDQEFSFGWMLSDSEAKPNAIAEFVGATGPAKHLQDPDADPDLLIRYGDRRVA